MAEDDPCQRMTGPNDWSLARAPLMCLGRYRRAFTLYSHSHPNSLHNSSSPAVLSAFHRELQMRKGASCIVAWP